MSAKIRHLPSSPDPDQPGLKEFLTKLHALMEKADERNLMQKVKAEALKEVGTLASAGEHPDSVRKRGG